ncbi:hypothetical protein CcrC1_gp223c [Caulobacter phage C1]|nr:hypothetical protein CcrC1_gp223c [Caulobacter phage C1]UTU08452.1 hypothetical protein CcrC2_gp224c [Caulobacter phage C2]UTU08969.1 hypothetical protein CcrJ4_gp218c [Caulobacter phage J4]UTU10085.1 hypothetical protein CcrRB23_gp223c [Caulobacter phage RB23]WGN97120.1 hypothetical protein [Bertelyvirus sp.]
MLTSVQYETIINQLRAALREARNELDGMALAASTGADTRRRRAIVSTCDLAIRAASPIEEVPL